MKKINLSAPGKLMLFGDHAVIYGKPCLVAAVDQEIKVSLSRLRSNESVFVSTTRELFEKKYGSIERGFKITGFDRRYGLGSSAATTVAVAETMFSLKKIMVSKKQLFDFCYQVVKKVQGVGSGFDVAAAIWKGVVYFVTGGLKIDRLSATALPLVVGYSGVKADTTTMVKKAAGKINNSFLGQSEKIVKQAKIALIKKNWKKVGKLMNQNQELLRQIGVSTPRLERLINASLEAGAFGAKLSGAGGGDCMIALVSPKLRQAVERAIKNAGGQVLKVKLTL